MPGGHHQGSCNFHSKNIILTVKLSTETRFFKFFGCKNRFFLEKNEKKSFVRIYLTHPVYLLLELRQYLNKLESIHKEGFGPKVYLTLPRNFKSY
jgi:hypothetical protein